MIFVIGFSFIAVGLLANDGWPGMLLGGGGGTGRYLAWMGCCDG